MIELLENCVRIPSFSRQERSVAEFLRSEMQRRGFDQAYIDAAGNAVGIIGRSSIPAPDRQIPNQIVLLGHMDTVGGDVPVRYEDGKLYGRGTVDAKGPLCAFILAAQQVAGLFRLQAATNPPTQPGGGGWQIVVIGAVEEEAATSKGARFAATRFAPEMCIIGEPSGVDGITLGYKGRLLARARFEYELRHTAQPIMSASETAVTFWNRVKQFAERYNGDIAKVFDQLQLSLRSLESGDNGLHEWCEALVGLRLPLAFDTTQAAKMLDEYFRQTETLALTNRETIGGARPLPAGAEIKSLGSNLKLSGHEDAYRSSKDTPLARAFVDAIRSEKLRPAFKHKTGTADFNVVGPVWQCPIVAYGPGDSSLDHTPGEHVRIDEFEQAVKVLTHVLTTILTQAQAQAA